MPGMTPDTITIDSLLDVIVARRRVAREVLGGVEEALRVSLSELTAVRWEGLAARCFLDRIGTLRHQLHLANRALERAVDDLGSVDLTRAAR